jgi:thiol:disulfide interchange protein DsbC
MKTTDRAWAAVALVLAGAACNAAAAPAATDETRLLAALKKAHPGTRFTGVARTPIPDVYEAWMGPNMALVSSRNLRYLVFGRVFDTKAMTDLTAPKLAQAERLRMATAATENRADTLDNTAPAIPLAQLPLADAIKTVRGDGQHTMVVFSDPACPYCKRLESELDKLADVTIYTFLVPFQGSALPIAIWCATDRQAAWHQTMTQGDQSVLATSSSPLSCAHPLERNLALAKRLNVRGTPTIFYANGHRTDGYADAAEIEARLASAASHVPHVATRGQEVLP